MVWWEVVRRKIEAVEAVERGREEKEEEMELRKEGDAEEWAEGRGEGNGEGKAKESGWRVGRGGREGMLDENSGRGAWAMWQNWY